MKADEERPIVFGLLALVGVAVAVGLVTSVALSSAVPTCSGWAAATRPSWPVTAVPRWRCRSR